MKTNLTRTERNTLAECEAVIRRGVATFYEVGEALWVIRDQKLYRETHATWEDYCRQKWDMGKSHVYRLIAACEVGQDLSPIGDKPQSEAVAREIAKAPREKRAELWETACDTADVDEDGKPQVTAQHVAETRKALEQPFWDEGDVVEVILDREGQAVPESLVDVFADLESWGEALSLASRLKAVSTRLRGAPGGDRLELAKAQLNAAIRDVRAFLTGCQPWAVCPYCECADTHLPLCKACQSLGWVTRTVWNQRPKR